MSKLFVNTIAPNSGDTVTVSGSLTTTGKLTIGDASTDTVAITAEITSSLIPDLDNKFDLGSSTKRWKDLFVQSASLNGLSVIGGINSDLTPLYAPFVHGINNTSFFLGTSAKPWLGLHVHTASLAKISSSLIPDKDNTYDLGSSAQQWKDLYVNGTSFLDEARVVGSLQVTGSAFVDNLKIDGNTISSIAGTDLNITPLAGQQVVIDGAVTIDAGVVTGVTSITATTASISAVNSSLIPLTDNTRDLGSSTKEFKDLYLDGIAYLDSASIDKLHVDNIVIDANTISTRAGTDLNITPLAGQQIVLDGTINVDAGVISGCSNLFATAVSSSAISSSTLLATTANVNKLNLTKTTAASRDLATQGGNYSVNGSKVEVRAITAAQINDGAFATFKLLNTSIATDSLIHGAFTGNHSNTNMSSSIISVATIAASTASVFIHNETGGAIAADTPFTASFVIL